MTTFAPIFAPAQIRAAVDDRAWFEAILDAERGLVNAGAACGIVPLRAAELVAECCRVDLYDVETILAAGRDVGNPVEPLVRAIRERVGVEGAEWVHRGATSQDMLDSAAMLVAARSIDLILEELAGAAAALAGLAETHQRTVMAARTLLQQAVPTTFGLKAANWLVGLLDAWNCLGRVRRDGLAVQLGGAAGTLAAYGSAGGVMLELFSRELGLAEPTLPWHTNRVRMAELGGALCAAAGASGKIGRDITLLAQTEVGEVVERPLAGRGASSTMPHKRNPIGSVIAVACARSAAAAAGLLVASPPHELERAAGAWHAEWGALSDALLYAGGSAAAIREVLQELVIFPERMRDNLDRTGGVVLAEQATFALAERVGLTEARAILARLSDRSIEGCSLRDELLADASVREVLSEEEIDALVDPHSALGAVDTLVGRALARYAVEVGGGQ